MQCMFSLGKGKNSGNPFINFFMNRGKMHLVGQGNDQRKYG